MRAKLPFLCLLLAAGTAQGQLAVTFRNTVDLPSVTTDQFGQPFTVTGLSGICPISVASNTFWAVMDNSDKLIRLDVQVTPNGTISSALISAGLKLAEVHDMEGIAARFSGSSFVTVEEDSSSVRQGFLNTGQVYSVSQAAAVFANTRPNFGLESLAAEFGNSPFFWAANEEALTVDGPQSSQASGTVVRLYRFAPGAGPNYPSYQYAYVTEPWHGSAISSARSGVCDLAALPDGKLLVLERSFAFSLSGLFQSRIYEVDFTGATDVSSLPGLAGQSFTPVSKRLLYQGDQQNMEGLTLGRHLGSGRYALLGIVDDGDPISVNRVVGFELSGVGLPICYANCDQSDTPPVLTANDFQCYLNAFAVGSSYANCDGSTSVPLLTANDFQCFLSAYAGGCG